MREGERAAPQKKYSQGRWQQRGEVGEGKAGRGAEQERGENKTQIDAEEVLVVESVATDPTPQDHATTNIDGEILVEKEGRR